MTEKEQISEVTERVTGVEVDLKNLTGNVNRLTESWERQSSKINNELDKLAEQFSTFVAKVGRPDWAVIGMLGGGLITIVTAVGGMAIAPLYLIYIFQSASIKEVHDWQLSYMEGKVPSSATGEIAQVRAEAKGGFAENNSKLEAFIARMGENEAWLNKGIDRNRDRIDALQNNQCEFNRERTK